MGTSKSLPTPTGGAWSGVKRDITNLLGGSLTATQVRALVGNAMDAAGSIAAPSASAESSARHSSIAQGKAAVQSAVRSVAGFGSAVQAGGLTRALETLNLSELRDHSAVEVVSRIAERIAEEADGLNRDLLEDAFRNAILDVASLDEDHAGYEDLEKKLQDFLSRDGIEGLVISFLSEFVFDRIWGLVEQHAQDKSKTASSLESLAAAVKSACRARVKETIPQMRSAVDFDRADWFGRDGLRLATQIVNDLEASIRALSVRTS